MEHVNQGLGLVGRKVAMTRVFNDDGAAIAVTVIDVSDNRVAQIKSLEQDRYSAVQIAFGKVKPRRINKSQAGHLAKAQVEPSNVLKEFRVTEAQLKSYKVGEQVPVTLFKVGQKVDVQGVTLGKGFSGTIKRHHFGSQRASHGNSRSHNVPGSISMAQDPGRVFPGKKMSGHLGHVVRKVQNLSVVRIDETRNLIFVRGAVAGHDGNVVIVYPAAKAKGEQHAA